MCVEERLTGVCLAESSGRALGETNVLRFASLSDLVESGDRLLQRCVCHEHQSLCFRQQLKVMRAYWDQCGASSTNPA